MSAILTEESPAAPKAAPERKIVHHRADKRLLTLGPDTLNAFYLKEFGMPALPDAARLLPPPQEGFVPFIVREGLTINGTLAVLRKFGNGVSTADLSNPGDLDANFVSHDREAGQNYGFLFRHGASPDTDLSNMSTREFWDKHSDVKGMTLLERMLIDLYLCWQTIARGGDPHPTDAYLDWTMGACTICAGTRDHVGNPAIMRFSIRFLAPGINIGDRNLSAVGAGVRRVVLLGD